MTNRWRAFVGVSVFLVLFTLPLALLYITRTVSFNIVAQTEKIVVTTDDPVKFSWFFSEALFSEIFTDEDPEPFTGFFEPRPGSVLTIERLAFGKLIITAEKGIEQSSDVGTLKGPDGAYLRTLETTVQLQIDDIKGSANRGDTLYLPIEGNVSIGADTPNPTGPLIPVLRKATVSLLASELFRDTVFIGGTYHLDLGDLLEVEDPESAGHGFVLANEGPGFQVVFRTKGRSAQVSRFGARGYTISLSVWQRLWNESIVKELLYLLSVVVGVNSFFRLIKGKS